MSQITVVGEFMRWRGNGRFPGVLDLGSKFVALML
jgi:hypothetical protein